MRPSPSTGLSRAALDRVREAVEVATERIRAFARNALEGGAGD